MPGDTFWKGEPVETMHRDVLIEIARQQHFRIEALEAEERRLKADIVVKARILTAQTNHIEALKTALQVIADAPAWGAPDRWETTPAEVRQLARDALAPEQDK